MGNEPEEYEDDIALLIRPTVADMVAFLLTQPQDKMFRVYDDDQQSSSGAIHVQPDQINPENTIILRVYWQEDDC